MIFAEFFRAIELLAYPRGFVPSRIKQGRRRALLLPHMSAFLHLL